MSGQVHVFDNAEVFNQARLSDNVQVFNQAQVFGHAIISDNVQIYKDAKVCQGVQLNKDYKITSDLESVCFPLRNIYYYNHHLFIGGECHSVQYWLDNLEQLLSELGYQEKLTQFYKQEIYKFLARKWLNVKVEGVEVDRRYCHKLFYNSFDSMMGKSKK